MTTTSSTIPKRRIRLSAEQRRRQIADQAWTLLADEGHASFSLREIAQRCGIRLAAVQHHFRTKADLLEAITTGVLADYGLGLTEASGADTGTPRERLRNLLAFFLETNGDRRIAGFFLALWALAHHDAAARASLRRLHVAASRNVAELIGEIDPAVPPEEAARRAVLTLAAADGLLVSTGYGKSPPLDLGADAAAWMVDGLMTIALPGRDEPVPRG